MKKLLLLIFCIGILSYTPPKEYYNSLTGNITCEKACWHEIGHKLDHQNGWISETPEFRKEVLEHFEFDEDFFSIYYLFDQEFGWYAEYYAEVLQSVNGNIDLLPDDFRQFYDAEQIKIISEGVNNDNN